MNQVEQTFDYILKKYGHDVLLLRNNTEEVCTCFDPVTGSAERHCPYCFGMGTVPRIERRRVRMVDTSHPASNSMATEEQNFGEMLIAARAYFFYEHVPVQPKDLIIEVEWDGDIPIYNNGTILEVSIIDAPRFENGKVSFRKAYVKSEPIMRNIRGFQAVKKAGDISYRAAVEKGRD